MFNFIKLNCPTCGASLNVNKESTGFACQHCGNNYVLEHKASDLKPADRANLTPLTTYTHQLKQWLKVGAYEICLHEIVEKTLKETRVFCINVEYRNPGKETLSCRRNQWILFDSDGYTYDNDFTSTLYEGLPGQPLGGDRLVTPGSHLRGWVVFKLSQSATVNRLQFLTSILSTKTAEYIFE
jgi:DNA-directed RNA polymerase subunit RPC12/RpoP